MKKYINNSDGFTLIESIVTLAVVSVLVLFPVISFNQVNDQVKVDLFVEELSSGITLMQNHAIFNGESTRVEAQPAQRRFLLRVNSTNGHPLNHYLDLPDSVELPKGFKSWRFTAHNGNINKNERLHLYTSQGEIQFVFQMGSGRFYVQKINK